MQGENGRKSGVYVLYMSILIGLAHEGVFNAAAATQLVFQQLARRIP